MNARHWFYSQSFTREVPEAKKMEPTVTPLDANTRSVDSGTEFHFEFLCSVCGAFVRGCDCSRDETSGEIVCRECRDRQGRELGPA